jgi:hypothetical protein
MPNLDAFLDLCRRVSTETDPIKLADLKGALEFMLQSRGIELLGVELKRSLEPN